ncbi:Metallo-dependent phosphatase [Piromyces finnis]|uniref:Metallo-dependent phosphatase n=1 Tax=Piromyces finnis TaxID=1754191 RepID=A0A1Y1UX07_9FUNG|nr:Metallo-dependent phosphatase [Piromyces finnis]|eukprot:ORX42561.1 Metallo-dependent phosphatase [Piromyces finnis]
MKFPKILLLSTLALGYANSKSIKNPSSSSTTYYDSFNYNFHCSKKETSLCSLIEEELTDAVLSLSTILDISPSVQFDVVVDDISKYRSNTKKETFATTVNNNFVLLDSRSIVKSPYPNSENLIKSFDSDNKFSKDDFILLINNFNSDSDFLKSSNYDFRNNIIKEIVKGLQALNKLKSPYNSSTSTPPPPPGGQGGNPPPGGNGGNPPPPSSSSMDICDTVQRNKNNTAVLEDARSNDETCENKRANKLSSIINWKNKLIKKGDPSETSNYKYKRLVAIGDIHGDYNKLISVMRHAKLIDSKDKWIAKNTILVQTGDLIDRGNDIKEILEFLRHLQSQVSKYDSVMYLLLGNHEINNLQGQYQFTSEGDITTFNSMKNREKFFSVNGKYGRMLRGEMDVMVAVNDSLFAHAGVSSTYAEQGIDAINERIRDILINVPSFDEMCTLSKNNITNPIYTEPVLNDQNGPLTTRSFANDSEDKICSDLEKTLAITKTKRMVIGHNVQEYGEIQTRCDDKLILIDLGMSSCYGNYFGYLEILNDKNEVWAIYNH